VTAKCLHNESFRVAYDIIHAMPLQAYQYLRHLETEPGKIPGRSSKSLEIQNHLINLEHFLSTQTRSAESRISTGRPMAPTYSFTSCRRCVISRHSLVISQMTHVIASSTSTSKKSQRSFGPLMTTSTSQMASLASNWQIPNQQQSIISNTSNRLDFYAVAPSIFSVWSSWRERILDILKRQRWI